MKLTQNFGGFGVLDLSNNERKTIDKLFELNNNLHEKTKKKKFESLFNDIFDPMIIPTNEDSRKIEKIWGSNSISNRYPILSDNLTDKTETIIFYGFAHRSQIPHINAHHLVLIRDETKILGSLVLDGSNQLLDDIVDDLGEIHRPKPPHLPINGPLQLNKELTKYGFNFGLPNIGELKDVKELYDQASQLVYSAKKLIGVSEKELTTLSNDSYCHPNIALRKISFNEYEKLIKELVGNYKKRN